MRLLVSRSAVWKSWRTKVLSFSIDFREPQLVVLLGKGESVVKQLGYLYDSYQIYVRVWCSVS
jgi:hypothetical protein